MKHLAVIILGFIPLFSPAQENPGTDSLGTGRLGIVAEAVAFFRDNEYLSDLTKGYSLPGAWVRPTVQYNPLDAVHLELGFHALFYNGANKYPNYVYHDIGTWKGNQYQDASHVLPWFRAQAALGEVTVVLGDIYGAGFHDIIFPLYNPEQLLSSDPEAGAQILWKHKRFSSDLYINWQSYQFEEDTHQEAFTVGLTARLALGGKNEWSARLNVLAHHRGGEQDITDLGVQTLWNASLGAAFRRKLPGTISMWRAQADVLACYQQAGHLWPFTSGAAVHAGGGAELWNSLSADIGYFFSPKNFVSLFGNPFFSSVSITGDCQAYDRLSTAYFILDYHRTLGKYYTFGADFEGYKVNSYDLNEFSFSFGLYIRVSPLFKL